jgi:glucose-6-phosphate 1-dehydrogenase
VLGGAGAQAPLEFALSADTESASTRLLRAALAGDDTFTLGPDEPEEAWRIVEAALDA